MELFERQCTRRSSVFHGPNEADDPTSPQMGNRVHVFIHIVGSSGRFSIHLNYILEHNGPCSVPGFLICQILRKNKEKYIQPLNWIGSLFL